MAPKRLLEDPPSAASDSEETEESEFENDAAEDDEEDNVSDGPEDEEDGDDDQLSKKPATVSALSTPSQTQRTQSGSGDETGSDSDTESDKTEASLSASAFTVKPVVAKPTDMKSSSAKRNLNLAAAPAPTVASGSKRTSQRDIEGKDSKKKKVSNGNDDDAKKGHFQRIWTVDDEVAILKGMIEFQSKRGKDPLADMGIFYEFLKNNLHADMSEKQLMDKIRRLKKKYQNNAKKGENGEDPVLSKPHELKCYELSKKIWGAAASNGVNENAKKKKKPTQSRVRNSSALASPNANVAVKKDEEANGEANDEVEKPSSNSSLLDDLLGSGKLFSQQPEAAANIMKEALPLIGSAEANELERKWKNLQEEEFELFSRRMELVHESAKLLLEAKKSSKF